MLFSCFQMCLDCIAGACVPLLYNPNKLLHTVVALPCFHIITLLNCCLVTLLSCYIVVLLHCCLATLLYCYIVRFLHSFIITLLLCCSKTKLHLKLLLRPLVSQIYFSCFLRFGQNNKSRAQIDNTDISDMVHKIIVSANSLPRMLHS